MAGCVYSEASVKTAYFLETEAHLVVFPRWVLQVVGLLISLSEEEKVRLHKLKCAHAFPENKFSSSCTIRPSLVWQLMQKSRLKMALLFSHYPLRHE